MRVLILDESQERVAEAKRLLVDSGYRVEDAPGIGVDGQPIARPDAAETNAFGGFPNEAAPRPATSISAVLDALPAQIAQLDASGNIVSFNQAWRDFSPFHAIHGADSAGMHNYLAICDGASGEGSEDAHAAADGIRKVLHHDMPDFVMDYPCHSPTQHRWYRLHVNPLPGGSRRGAVVMHLDITERKSAENRLRRSEANLAASQRIAHLGSWELDLVNMDDLASGALRWSDEVFRIWGYHPGEIEVTYENFLAAVHPDDRDLISNAVNTALRESRAYDLTHRIRRPDGTERIVREQAEFLFDPGTGQPVRMIGTVLDVTEQHLAERAINRALERLNEAQRIAQIGDWEWEIETQEILWSPQVYEIFGRDPALGPPKDYDDVLRVYDSPSRSLHDEKVALALSSGQEQRYELVIVRPDGSRRQIQAVSVPRKNTDGRITALYGTIQDISARKQAEALLATSEQRLALATQAVRMGVWDWDIPTNHQLWDSRMYALHGVDRAQFDPTFDSWSCTLHPDDRERVRSDFAGAVAGSRELHTEYRIRLPNGDIRFIESHGLVRANDAGVPVRMLGVDWDITERVALEERLRHSERMEAVGQLTGGVAHDFNNLLAVILGNADLLGEELRVDSPQRELAESIGRAAQRGAELTKRLLAFSRRQSLEARAVDLNAVVTGMKELLAPLLGDNILLTYVLDDDPCIALVDVSQLENAVLNLCLNARDAMPEGGRITIQTDVIVFDANYASRFPDLSAGGYAMIAVADTGVGIPADVLSRVFEPFFTTKATGYGTGLGLAMVFGFVKQSGGHVGIDSMPGRGTTTRMYFPMANAADVQAQARPADQPPPRGSECILLVEDDVEVRRFALQQVAALGYRVVAASGARDAMDFIRSGERFDLLFTDVLIPGGMNGPQLAKAARQLRPDLKVLYTSGYAAGALGSQAPLDNEVILLQKPYRMQELARVLRLALKGDDL